MLIFFRVADHDQSVALGMLESLRNVYGNDQQVAAISDGPVLQQEVTAALEALDVMVFTTETQLKQFGRLEEYLTLQYTLLLDQFEDERFMQVDPDTRFHRVPYLPPGDWVGQVKYWPDYQLRYTRTCACILSRGLIETLLTAMEGETTDFRYIRNGEERPSVDATIAHYFQTLGAVPLPWCTPEGISEVCLRQNYDERFANGRWAITHPWRGDD